MTLIPRDIYVTWKTKNRSDCPRWMREYFAGWEAMNPDHRFHLCDDADCDRHFREERQGILDDLGIDILKMREQLMTKVEHSDLWRYVIIYTRGGVYTDADTACMDPCEVWIKPEDRAVIGFEEKNCSHPWQYCQWTFAAEPKHPFFALLLKRVAESIVAERGKKSIDTLKRTGPIVFTNTLQEYLENAGIPFLSVASQHARGPEGMQLLPREAFRGGHVYHRFAGTWKSWFDRPNFVWRKYNTGLELKKDKAVKRK